MSKSFFKLNHYLILRKSITKTYVFFNLYFGVIIYLTHALSGRWVVCLFKLESGWWVVLKRLSWKNTITSRKHIIKKWKKEQPYKVARRFFMHSFAIDTSLDGGAFSNCHGCDVVVSLVWYLIFFCVLSYMVFYIFCVLFYVFIWSLFIACVFFLSSSVGFNGLEIPSL